LEKKMKFILAFIIGIYLTGCSPVMATTDHIGDANEMVYKTIAMESASEPEGMKYVALTIINRARARGTSLQTEALRRKQYSCWNSQSWAKAWLGKHYGVKTRLATSKELETAFKMASEPRFQGIRHYHTVNVHPNWAVGHTPVFRIGSHLFYEGIK
jgi:uncharacterized protein YceK